MTTPPQKSGKVRNKKGKSKPNPSISPVNVESSNSKALKKKGNKAKRAGNFNLRGSSENSVDHIAPLFNVESLEVSSRSASDNCSDKGSPVRFELSKGKVLTASSESVEESSDDISRLPESNEYSVKEEHVNSSDFSREDNLESGLKSLRPVDSISSASAGLIPKNLKRLRSDSESDIPEDQIDTSTKVGDQIIEERVVIPIELATENVPSEEHSNMSIGPLPPSGELPTKHVSDSQTSSLSKDPNPHSRTIPARQNPLGNFGLQIPDVTQESLVPMEAPSRISVWTMLGGAPSFNKQRNVSVAKESHPVPELKLSKRLEVNDLTSLLAYVEAEAKAMSASAKMAFNSIFT